jgi:hypothetical protein
MGVVGWPNGRADATLPTLPRGGRLSERPTDPGVTGKGKKFKTLFTVFGVKFRGGVNPPGGGPPV